MHDRAERRPDRQRSAFGDRVSDRNEFDFERAELDAAAERHGLDLELRQVHVVDVLGFEQAGREPRREDPATQLWPKIGHGPDMVLMGMRDDEAEEILPDPLDESEVRQQQVDARQVRPGKRQPAIHHDPLAPFRWPEAVKRGIHADFAQASERAEDQFFAAVRHFLSSTYDAAVMS